MRKIIFCLVIVLSLTGCVSNEDFSKTCKYETKTIHLSDFTSINVVYDNVDVVKEAIVIKNYKALDEEVKDILKSVKEANASYNKKYGGKSVKVYISKDSEYEYEIKYDLDVQKLDDDTLKEFKLRKNSIKFFNKMKDENIECEGK